MLEAISLDPKTIIVRSDKENDLSEIIDYITQKHKRNQADALLRFTATHKALSAAYKFNRENCYDR
ncbi:MAG: hypothetical protein LBT94_03825 [Prevotellaceae bacterium]|jgi:hypothetical protein|nr:hypothetical protein [Prevotellaceae bacterium]